MVAWREKAREGISASADAAWRPAVCGAAAGRPGGAAEVSLAGLQGLQEYVDSQQVPREEGSARAKHGVVE